MKKTLGNHRRHSSVFKTGRTGGTVGAMRGASGQVLAIVTLGIFVLMAFVGLAVDLGQFWSVRRHMQTAADAAAVAGATALRRSGSASAAAAAASLTNGFANGTNHVTVTVHNPPSAGVYAGNTNYVEVIVSQPQPTYFMRALGYASIPVSTRSVASSISGPACLYALDPTDSGTVTVSGSSTATLTCGAIIDSSSSSALSSNGGGTLTATNIGVNGGYSGSGFTPTPVTGVAPAPDPLSFLPAPTGWSASQCTAATTNVHAGTSKGTTTLQPGVYCGAIQVSGNNPVVFSSGVYILLGGMKVTASKANVSGTGVMFYNTSTSAFPYGIIDLGGSETANFSAPTTGTYAGILFFQDRSVAVGTAGSNITGASGSAFDGTVYFPTTNVNYAGNSSSTGYTIIVAYTFSVKGNSKLSDNYSSLGGGSPLKSTALYE
jgi:hypothetical protein